MYQITNRDDETYNPMKNIKKLASLIILFVIIASCSEPKDTTVADNIKKYTHVWDEVLNNRKIEMINDSNFATNVVCFNGLTPIHGIDSTKIFYNNYLTGFSDIKFIMNDVFGQENKLVKHWTFIGKHSCDFFGIPATGKQVNIEGTTLVKMEGGKIVLERDFFDNLEFSQQLGLIPR